MLDSVNSIACYTPRTTNIISEVNGIGYWVGSVTCDEAKVNLKHLVLKE